MDIRKGDPEYNLARAAEWIYKAASRGSDLIVLPELWDTGYALEDASRLGTPLGSGRFVQVAQLAAEHRIHVVGSMLEAEMDANGSFLRAYNTVCWFDARGETIGVYRKLHLFRLMQEEKYLAPGSSTLVVNTSWGKAGVAICYDLRFPELFRRYGVEGAVMTILPAQWPTRRITHWRTLLQARAIENQMIVVGCNRVGRDNSAMFGGHSVILDAWGEPAAEAGDEEKLLTASVDLSSATRARKAIPVFDDRRPDIY
nr:carbon-nitrogen family hydrolase [Anaerolineae bacterium]